jgi:hypothetical protein
MRRDAVAETYWRCKRCGEVVTQVAACRECWDCHDGWSECEPVAVVPVEELERLRGIEARLRDDKAAEDIGTRGMWPDEAIDTYRRAMLGEEQ